MIVKEATIGCLSMLIYPNSRNMKRQNSRSRKKGHLIRPRTARPSSPLRGEASPSGDR